MSNLPAAVRPQYVGAGETAAAFARALLGGDAAAAASFFSPTAQVLTPDGTELSGRHSIAELLSQLTDSDPQLAIRTGRTLLVERVALCTQYWVRRSGSHETSSTARLVLARDDRLWQILIAAPWG